MKRFEHQKEPLLPRKAFLVRLAFHWVIAGGIILGSLGLGILGYHHFEGLSWLDSLLEASMILTGMGPAHELRSDAGKIFASAYALFCGIVFITVMGVLFAPIAHRLLHKFHAELE